MALGMIDTLSDVLRSVQLSGAVFFALDAPTPAAFETMHTSARGRHALSSVEHVIEYHLVTEGACSGTARGAPVVRLEAGDVLVLPHGDGQLSPHREHEPTHVICGFLGCSARPFSPLLATLPRAFHLRGLGHRESARRRLVELGVAETAANRAGSDCMLARLGELLFADVVRQHADSSSLESYGWLAGLRDHGIGRALQKLHERPAHPWTLESLAKDVGMSRSALAERFTDFLGVPPIHYLAQWRIQMAASLLRGSKSSLAEIAFQVGYGSEAALSRAYKRCVGVAPAEWRRGKRSHGALPAASDPAPEA